MDLSIIRHMSTIGSVHYKAYVHYWERPLMESIVEPLNKGENLVFVERLAAFRGDFLLK